MQNNKRNQKGISLSELLITLVVLGLALSPIVNFFSQALRQSNENRIRSQLRYLAEEEMEKILSLDYFSSELDIYSNFGGKKEFIEKGDFIIKLFIAAVDPETLAVAEPYPSKKEEDTLLKKIIISTARKDYLGGQVDIVFYKSP